MSTNYEEMHGAMVRIRMNLAKAFADMKLVMQLMEKAEEDFEPRAPEVATIVDTVCEFYRVRPAQVYSTSRLGQIVKAKQVAVYIACQITTLSQRDIAYAFNKTDHAWVIYCRDKVASLIGIEPVFNKEVEAIKTACSRQILAA